VTRLVQVIELFLQRTGIVERSFQIISQLPKRLRSQVGAQIGCARIIIDLLLSLSNPLSAILKFGAQLTVSWRSRPSGQAVYAAHGGTTRSTGG
jgi:hypothetical protein